MKPNTEKKITGTEYVTALKATNAAWLRVCRVVSAMDQEAADGPVSQAAHIKYTAGAVLTELADFTEKVQVVAALSDGIARQTARGTAEDDT